ncbi:MAG: T9SS type A sorting domain-containing protein [Bacteroidales bacterium]|nr:T9SS type A sorting domain-containing protein [Bacteroidales bacterium]
MKKLLILSNLVLIISLTPAQNFVSEDNLWHVKNAGFPGFFTTEIFKVEGDSVVNLILYKKIWFTYDSALINWTYEGLIREDSNVVYFIPPDCNEGILYDFNLEIGDTTFIKNRFCQDTEVQVIVYDIDTVDYFGIQRKRWLIDNSFNEYWIDGIGSQCGPLHSKYYSCIICPSWDLLCFHKNETLLYIKAGETECYQVSVGLDETNTSDEITITPNPVNRGKKIEIQTFERIKSILIYNSSGVLIESIMENFDNRTFLETNQFQPGLYFLRIENKDKKTITKKIIII